MRRRIYWLLPDLASARKTMDDLLLARIEERHIHFVAPEGIDTAGLHPANILQTSDVLPAAQRGLVIGGASALVAGLLAALLFPVFGESSGLAALRNALGEGEWTLTDLFGAFDSAQWGMVAVLAVLGGAVGAWASSMIGVSVPSHRLERFAGAIAQGRLLLMVDVPHARVEEVEARLAAAHPEAHFEGEEPEVPAFP